MPLRLAGALIALLFATLGVATRPAQAAPWLFVTDIHLDPLARDTIPAKFGSDSNVALLDTTLAEMKHVDPDPPVIVIGGDFLAHNFHWSLATVTMEFLAHRFDAAFPNAQFVITLGNEDSSCGDYSIATHSRYLRDTARAWEPLVNRHGAAPSFLATFARDGFYTARLPVPRLRAVVVDDVFWSPRYRACQPSGNPSANAIAELRRALRMTNDRNWIVLHIPPGIDAYSTAHIAHRLVVVPFLDPGARDALLGAIADPDAHVALVVAAHTHKFAYRIAGTTDRPVPMLLVPSVSPIFRNAPGFLTAEPNPDGTLDNVVSYARLHSKWVDLGGFPALGVTHLTGPALVDLHRRLDHDAALRDRFSRLYEGGGPPEIAPANWPIYSCASTTFASTPFRACAKEGGFSLVTSRGIAVVAVLATLGVVAAVALAAALRFWYRPKRRRSGSG
jgi:sphingomyelin phosphodiesterase acid-like 3